MINSYSETYILTLIFMSQPDFCENPWEVQNTRWELSVTVLSHWFAGKSMHGWSGEQSDDNVGQ